METFNVNDLNCWIAPVPTRIRKEHSRPRKRPDIGKPVIQLSKKGIELNRFPSIADAAKAIGVCDASIRKAVKGERNHSAGFNWKFA